MDSPLGLGAPPAVHCLSPSPPCLRSVEPEDPAPTPPGPSSEGGAEAEVAEGAVPAEAEADGEAVLMEEDLIQQSLDDYDAGKYSPRLLTAHELPLDAHVLEPDEDLQRLLLSRQQLQVTGVWRGRRESRGESALSLRPFTGSLAQSLPHPHRDAWFYFLHPVVL